LDQSLDMVAEQSARVSPTLIMVNQLLALSSLELQQMVHAELESNPALESMDMTTCTSCGAGTNGVYCPVCMQEVRPSNQPDLKPREAAEKAAGVADDIDFEDFRPRYSGPAALEDEEFDPLSFVASEAGMAEQLLVDLAVTLTEDDYPIAEYLVGNLDEQGFLACSVKSAALDLDVPLERIERVLEVLQRTGPVGVGARDLRECLLIQLREIEASGNPIPVPHVREIITGYLTELGEHKFTIIAQQLGIGYDEVVAVRDYIKHHMEPRPLQDPPRGKSWRAPSPTRFVMPDVIIHLRDNKLEPEVVETYRFNLRISPLYQQLSSDSKPQGLSDGDRTHIKQYVNRSRLFISNINQRRETMRRITQCLIDIQEDFIRYGVRYLRPLTRAQVAQYLGIHESTVSRATADKYVMLPNKHVIPFSDFFSASLSAKDVIKEMITKEARPMTDKEIVRRLNEQGIRVARRTVTKYRNQLGIMPSTFR
jgi:RNA polymerase sigma-54 factor